MPNISQNEPQLTPETPQRSSTPASPNVTQEYAAVNNTGALQVRFQKIDGTMYVVEAVPDSRRSALAIVSAYIQKNSGSNGQVLNIPQSGPQLTSETPVGSSASAVSNITQEYAAVNSTGALQVRFQKKIDGTMYVVEAVPDSKQSALAVVTAYIQKNSGSEGTVLNISQSEPQLTPETPQRSSTPAVSNVTQGETAVNSESQGDDGLGTANAGFDPVSQWHKSYTKRDCVHSPFFTDAVSETEA